MTSDTIVLATKGSKQQTFSEWFDQLKEYFESLGFTIMQRKEFGVIDDELVFGVKLTEDKGFVIHTLMWNNIYSAPAFAYYTIIGDVVSFYTYSGSRSTNQFSLIGTNVYLNVNYDTSDTHKFIDMIFNGVEGGVLATPYTVIGNAERDIALICLAGGMVANATILGLAGYPVPQRAVTTAFNSDRYSCYTCSVVIIIETIIAFVNELIGMVGNFTHSYMQEIELEGKHYICLGNGVYMPL